MIRLTRVDFRRWLVRNRKVIVGLPDDLEDCPMCRYLKSRGAKKIWMTFGYRVVDGRSHNNGVKWQREFQRQAVRLERELDVIGLRGQEALDVLDSV